MNTQKLRHSALQLGLLAGAVMAQCATAAPFTVNLTPLGANRPSSATSMGVRAGGGRAYTANKNAGVFIYDVSNPASPTVVGNFVEGVAEDVEVVGNYLLAATGGYGLHVVDASNPAQLVKVRTFPVTANHVHAAGGYACAISANGYMTIIDMRDPANPVLLASGFALGTDNSSGVYIQGRYVYTGCWNEGLKVVDIGNPASPVIVGGVNSPYSTREVFVLGRYAYVGEDDATDGGLWVIDVNNPTAPTYLAGSRGPSNHPYGVRVANGLAYVTDTTVDAVRVFDVGNPLHPTQVGIGYCEDTPMDVAVDGNQVYVAENEGLKVFGLSWSGAVTPTFVSAPTNAMATAGQTVTFAVAASGAPTPSIRWQRSTDGGASWADLAEGAGFSDVETPTLRVSTTVAMDGCRFRARASSLAGTNVGLAATLAVSGLPLITVQPASQRLLSGQSTTLAVTAFGAPPLNYQWRLNQEGLAGATNATLGLSNVAVSQGGDYSVVVSNAYGAVTSAVATLTVYPSLTLPIALDAPTLSWSTSGSAIWWPQTVIQHDGFAAARSGTITHGQQSVLDTTVQGPGTLTFWWKVSSEVGYDFLKFLRNGAEEASISGSVDWQQKTFALPAGAQTLRWVYQKDWSTSAGFDAGWLDEVRFTPAPPQWARASFSGGTFSMSFETRSGSNYVVEYKESLSQSNWVFLRALTGDGTTQVLSDSPGTAPQRFYRVRLP